MQTHFQDKQLENQQTQQSNAIIRSCVHCGFCTATCPTYQVLGDELDSPRGRIYQIKEMLENDSVPTDETVLHIDRCLSCLACATTCPSGVDYMHLIDHARAYIDKKYKRSFLDTLLREALLNILPYRLRFRCILFVAKFLRPLRFLVSEPRLRSMLDMARVPIMGKSHAEAGNVFPAEDKRRYRVALLVGCVQPVLNDTIHAATIRLLNRLGCEVITFADEGCCGALAQHMGRTEQSKKSALQNVARWQQAHAQSPLDAIIINTSGCGTMVKDYGHILLGTKLADEGAYFANITLDVTEFIAKVGLPEAGCVSPLKVAYHAACSLQHGQKITHIPKELLTQAGFMVVEPRESHLCCGSAGTYNLLQPAISEALLTRKAQNILQLQPQVIATGNLGCMKQIARAIDAPIVHVVELLDWATGGTMPPSLEGIHMLPRASSIGQSGR